MKLDTAEGGISPFAALAQTQAHRFRRLLSLPDVVLERFEKLAAVRRACKGPRILMVAHRILLYVMKGVPWPFAGASTLVSTSPGRSPWPGAGAVKT